MNRILDAALVAAAIGAGAAMHGMLTGGSYEPTRPSTVYCPVSSKTPGMADGADLPKHTNNPPRERRKRRAINRNVDSLFRAICAVESGNNPAAIGDNGRAVGISQIWPITVEDCNRILGRAEFTDTDRLDPERSYAMFCTFANHYGRGKSDEWIARAWNAGPGWERKPAKVLERTAEYWRKVRSHL